MRWLRAEPRTTAVTIRNGCDFSRVADYSSGIASAPEQPVFGGVATYNGHTHTYAIQKFVGSRSRCPSCRFPGIALVRMFSERAVRNDLGPVSKT